MADRVYVLAPPGEREEFIRDLEQRGYAGSRVVVVEQPPYDKGGYGSGAAARYLLEAVGSAETVIVVHGDLVLHDNVFKLLVQTGAPSLIAFRTRRDGRRYGVVVERNGVLARIVEKPGWRGEVLANSAVYLLPAKHLREALAETTVSPRGEIELPDAVNRVAQSVPVRVVTIPEEWRKGIGPWWDYLEANRMVLKWLVELGACREKPLPGVEGSAVICGEGYEINPPVRVDGVAWLGEGAVIGPYTRIRGPTIIHERVEVGAFVEVKASVLLEHVKAHHHAYIGDSVVAEHVNIAAGTITANLRHDGKNVKSCVNGQPRDTGYRKLGAAIGAYTRTGINTSISPGARIGPCNWISEATVVRRDTPPCVLVTPRGVKPRPRDECCDRLRAIKPRLCIAEYV